MRWVRGEEEEEDEEKEKKKIETFIIFCGFFVQFQTPCVSKKRVTSAETCSRHI
jgi:hypothetical protein